MRRPLCKLACVLLFVLVPIAALTAKEGGPSEYQKFETRGLAPSATLSFSIDSGAGQMSSGAYSLSGTVGQSDAGALQGGDFALVGGFTVPKATPGPLFADGFELGNTSRWTTSSAL